MVSPSSSVDLLLLAPRLSSHKPSPRWWVSTELRNGIRRWTKPTRRRRASHRPILSSPGAIVGGAALAFTIAGSMGFADAITGARSYLGVAYPGSNASPRFATRPYARPRADPLFVPPGAIAHRDAHPCVSSGRAGFLARGQGRRRATTTVGHGEWKKLESGPPVREKQHHIVVDGSAPCVAGEQIVAEDIGQAEEANEGAGEGEQVGTEGVGQGEEASEEAGEGEQVVAGDVEVGEGEQVGAGDAEDGVGASEDEEASEGVSEDEEASEGAGGESEQVSQDTCSDTTTSSRKRRKDPMIKIMEDILRTLQAHSVVRILEGIH